MDDMYEVKMELFNQLKCRQCREIIFPPYRKCMTGHLFCRACLEGLQFCSCFMPISLISRNYALERIVDKFSLECKNKGMGCKQRALGARILEHERVCENTPCPSVLDERCLWKGLQRDIAGHLKQKHPKIIFNKSKITLLLKNFLTNPIYSREVRSFYLETDERLFQLAININLQAQFANFLVLHVGSPEDPELYRYKIEVVNSMAKQCHVLLKSNCTPTRQVMVKHNFYTHNYFQIPIVHIEALLKDNAFVLSVEIGKCGLEFPMVATQQDLDNSVAHKVKFDTQEFDESDFDGCF